MDRLEIRPLGPEADFLRLHSEENGFGWCRCTAWWVPTLQGFGDRSDEENLALRREVFATGCHDGLLAYLNGDPVGWCQCGVRDRLPGIQTAFGSSPDPRVWAVTCFAVAPTARGRGVAAALLGAAIDLAVESDAATIEAYPRRDEPGGDGEEWTGPLGLFLGAGFDVVGGSNGRRLVVHRSLQTSLR